MIILDDLADVQPELLQRRVAAGLFLKLGEADVPFRLASAVLAADLIQAAFQRATQAVMIVLGLKRRFIAALVPIRSS